MARKKRPNLGAVGAVMADDTDQAMELIESRKAEREGAEASSKPKKQPNRKKLTLDIDGDLIREVRVACVELPPKLTGGGPSGFVSRAVERYLAELREQHNGGEPFESDEDPRIPRGPKRA